MIRGVKMPLLLPRADSRPTDVLTVGLNSMDLLARVDAFPTSSSKHALASFSQQPGGQAASAATALARLGFRTEYIGRYGDDAFGREGLASLATDGVDHARAVIVSNASSQFAIILVERTTGERTVLWHRHPGLTMTAEDIPDDAVTSARVVLVDCHETAAVTSAVRRARRAGARTVVDVERARPGIMDLLREIDVVIAAEGFPQACTGCANLSQALHILQRASGARVVCVTLGERGSLTRCGDDEIYVPAFDGPVVDTTGAGDVFRAGFIAGWLLNEEAADLQEVLRYASAVAFLKCRMLGARAGAPTRAEVSAFLAMQPSVRATGPIT